MLMREFSLLREPQPRTTPAQRPRNLVPSPGRRTTHHPSDRPPAPANRGPRTIGRRPRRWARRNAQRERAGRVVLQRLLDRFAVRIALRRGVARKAWRRAASFASAPSPRPRGGTRSHCQRFGVPPSPAQACSRRSSASRLKGAGRRGDREYRADVRRPGDLPEGPGALRFDLGRALLAPLFEQAGERDGLVVDAVGEAFQRLRRFARRRVGVGRDRVEPELEMLHRGSPWVAAKASRRCTSSCHTASFCASSITDQAAISSSVRRQPSHQPLQASILHTLMQGMARWPRSCLRHVGHRARR